jgi:hypothetical protein
MVSKYQNLSVEFIRNYTKQLNFDLLAANKHFNKKQSVNIIKSEDRWFIIEPPILNGFKKITFLEAAVEI